MYQYMYVNKKHIVCTVIFEGHEFHKRRDFHGLFFAGYQIGYILFPQVLHFSRMNTYIMVDKCAAKFEKFISFEN